MDFPGKPLPKYAQLTSDYRNYLTKRVSCWDGIGRNYSIQPLTPYIVTHTEDSKEVKNEATKLKLCILYFQCGQASLPHNLSYIVSIGWIQEYEFCLYSLFAIRNPSTVR